MRRIDLIKCKVARLEVLTGIDFQVLGCNGEYSVTPKSGVPITAFNYMGYYRKSKDLEIYLDGVIAGLEFNQK